MCQPLGPKRTGNHGLSQIDTDTHGGFHAGLDRSTVNVDFRQPPLLGRRIVPARRTVDVSGPLCPGGAKSQHASEMTLSLILAALWVLVASVLAALPSRDNHWTRAYILIAIAVPVLAFVAYQHSLWITAAVLLAMMSVLRWPLRYLIKKIATTFQKT